MPGTRGKIPSSANVWDAVFFLKIRRGGHDDARRGAIRVAANQGRRKDVEVAGAALAGSVEAFKVNHRDALFHSCSPWDYH
jgi:hypothetical protein